MRFFLYLLVIEDVTRILEEEIAEPPEKAEDVARMIHDKIGEVQYYGLKAFLCRLLRTSIKSPISLSITRRIIIYFTNNSTDFSRKSTR